MDDGHYKVETASVTRLHFVRIHRLNDDDLRGTTFARVGTYESDSMAMTDSRKWFKNLSIRV